MYLRKTYDEFDVQMLTESGWEVVNCEPSWAAAKKSVNEYRDNQPGTYRIVKHRVPIAPYHGLETFLMLPDFISCSGVPDTEYSHWAVLAESTDPVRYKKVSEFIGGRLTKSAYKTVATVPSENNGKWVTYLVLNPYTPKPILTKIEEICQP
jgi:hypothetical protein